MQRAEEEEKGMSNMQKALLVSAILGTGALGFAAGRGSNRTVTTEEVTEGLLDKLKEKPAIPASVAAGVGGLVAADSKRPLFRGLSEAAQKTMGKAPSLSSALSYAASGVKNTPKGVAALLGAAGVGIPTYMGLKKAQ